MSATSLQGYNHVTFLEFPVHQGQMLLHDHLPSKTGKQTSEIAFHLLHSEEIMELIKTDRMGLFLPVTELQAETTHFPSGLVRIYKWLPIKFRFSVKYQAQQVHGFGDHLVQVRSQKQISVPQGNLIFKI